MKKFKKNWIKVTEENQNEVSNEVEEKEEEKMSFFAKHKKGLIIGGLCTLAAGAAGLLIANKGSDDDFDEDLDDFEDSDTDEETANEGSEA